MAAISPSASSLALEVAREIRERRVLILMLGDTSMGMINGYFGPRLLNRHGFTCLDQQELAFADLDVPEAEDKELVLGHKFVTRFSENDTRAVMSVWKQTATFHPANPAEVISDD